MENCKLKMRLVLGGNARTQPFGDREEAIVSSVPLSEGFLLFRSLENTFFSRTRYTRAVRCACVCGRVSRVYRVRVGWVEEKGIDFSAPGFVK